MIAKRFCSLFLAAALALSAAGCSLAEDTAAVVSSSYAEGTPAAELAGLFHEYTVGCIFGNDHGVTVNFFNDDHTDFRQAACALTEEELAAFFSIDWFAEDCLQQCYDALAACDDLAIITPVLPDMTIYEAYIGRTAGDLEDDGLELGSYNEDENGSLVLYYYVYADDDSTYMIRVIPDVPENDDTIYDDDSVRELTVKEIAFWEFE